MGKQQQPFPPSTLAPSHSGSRPICQPKTSSYCAAVRPHPPTPAHTCSMTFRLIKSSTSSRVVSPSRTTTDRDSASYLHSVGDGGRECKSMDACGGDGLQMVHLRVTHPYVQIPHFMSHHSCNDLCGTSLESDQAVAKRWWGHMFILAATQNTLASPSPVQAQHAARVVLRRLACPNVHTLPPHTLHTYALLPAPQPSP
eukprot:164869-Chlamydomonas_euryale.AAC.1